ncbi:uncharacterized protein LOC135946715 [Cloeon dipterum]|uniref:uncharacterized protein LOC135946715 n=1 Tax=Cloeon dipterum TaxID=197152 RepID=UPI00321FB2A7
MNIVKAAARISSMRSILNPVRQNVGAAGPIASTNLSTRTLWHMCSPSSANNQMLTTKSHSLTYSSSIHGQDLTLEAYKKGLVDCLKDKISTRKHHPKELDGFKIEAKGPVLELSKELGNGESVKIYCNVNPKVNFRKPRRDFDDEMHYKPAEFRIELIKGDQILDLICSFNDPIDDCNGRPFKVDDIGLNVCERKHKIEIYTDSGKFLSREDSELQVLHLEMLKEKGIDFEFARKLYDVVIKYERDPYEDVLEMVERINL